MPITRSVWLDDDGSGTTGTILNNAELQKIYNNIDGALLGGAGVTANVVNMVSTGTVNNLACGPASLVTIISCSQASPVTITGLAFTTPPRTGDIVHICNRAASVVSLAHNSTSTIIFSNTATSAPTPIGFRGFASYVFLGGIWTLFAHEQGTWITPPFSAAEYYGSGAMTWTVTAGQVSACKYRLSGRTLAWALKVIGSTIGGTVGPNLFRAAFGGFTPIAGTITTIVGYQGGASMMGFVESTTALQFNRDFINTNWAAGATHVTGSGQYEVT